MFHQLKKMTVVKIFYFVSISPNVLTCDFYSDALKMSSVISFYYIFKGKYLG